MTNIAIALEAYKPQLKQRFTNLTANIFERLVGQFGPALRGVYNSDQARNWGAIRHMAVSNGSSMSSEYSLNADLVALGAEAFADATIVAWADKINEKLGELENAEVCSLDGFRFRIVGQKAGRKVCIEQDMILNVSNKGKLFNQFPARIYVDGKFTSAAKYAAI